MPSSTQRKRKGRDEATTPLLLLDIIDNWLKEMRRMWPQKELQAEEIENWHRDLGVFPQQAIEQGFEAWRRNGHWFPIYGDIIDLCIAYQPEPEYKPGCSRECKARHGRGYNQVDMTKLFDMYVARRQEVNGPLNQPEVERLLGKLDTWRGKAPEWRT